MEKLGRSIGALCRSSDVISLRGSLGAGKTVFAKGVARALGIDTGVIREGAWADLSLVDLNNTAFLSPGSLEANLVYAAHSDIISSAPGPRARTCQPLMLLAPPT